jgi:hypothetical protein
MNPNENFLINRVMYYKTDFSTLHLSSKGEAPSQLMQHLTAIYTAMSASMSKKGTKVIPPDCFF